MTWLPATVHNEAWVCTCGNDSSSDGFTPATSDGVPVEPYAGDAGYDRLDTVPGGWDERHYVCNACGAVIDQTTHEPNPDATDEYDSHRVRLVREAPSAA